VAKLVVLFGAAGCAKNCRHHADKPLIVAAKLRFKPDWREKPTQRGLGTKAGLTLK